MEYRNTIVALKGVKEILGSFWQEENIGSDVCKKIDSAIDAIEDAIRLIKERENK